MMQGNIIHAADGIIMPPAITTPIRTGTKEPMKYGKKNGALYIELKLAFIKKLTYDLRKTKLIPNNSRSVFFSVI